MSWIMNRDGFFSVVFKDVNEGELLIRARIKEDLARLATKLDIPESKIITTKMADYHYRLTVPAESFGGYLKAEAMAIDYDNFKGSLPHKKPIDKKRATAYMKVWDALFQMQYSI